MSLRLHRSRLGHWTDQINLVVLERAIVLVDVYDVIRVVDTEHGVVFIPVDVSGAFGLSRAGDKNDDGDDL